MGATPLPHPLLAICISWLFFILQSPLVFKFAKNFPLPVDICCWVCFKLLCFSRLALYRSNFYIFMGNTLFDVVLSSCFHPNFLQFLEHICKVCFEVFVKSYILLLLLAILVVMFLPSVQLFLFYFFTYLWLFVGNWKLQIMCYRNSEKLIVTALCLFIDLVTSSFQAPSHVCREEPIRECGFLLILWFPWIVCSHVNHTHTSVIC
jgi:hypothetical protein